MGGEGKGLCAKGAWDTEQMWLGGVAKQEGRARPRAEGLLRKGPVDLFSPEGGASRGGHACAPSPWGRSGAARDGVPGGASQMVSV